MQSPWKWIPSLYFGTGPAYSAVTTLSLVLYKQLGLSNAEITFYTGWLFLPWVLRPLWGPFVELVKSRRWWIVAMQLLIGAAFGGVAFTIPTAHWLQGTLCFFWLIAFSGVAHDTAVDAFYSVALDKESQAQFVGIRSAFYRLATIFGQGFLVMIAGNLQLIYRNSISLSWSLVFYAAAGLFVVLWLWHRAVLPHAKADEPHYEWSGNMQADFSDLWNEMQRQLLAFVRKFGKRELFAAMFFILFFRLPEALLSKVGMLFLVDAEHNGGLGLSPQEFGLVQGTIGVVALTAGSIIGGVVVNHGGLHRWLIYMASATALPGAVYLYLGNAQPTSLSVISICIFVSQLCLGFGTTAYLLRLIRYSRGTHHTFHYMLCTALMSAAQMLPSMFSGALQQLTGYPFFFLISLLCGIFPLLTLAKIKRR